MLEILPRELQTLANAMPAPLYAVGGCVRDYLAKLTPTIHDFDLSSPLSSDRFVEIAKAQGFIVQSVYRNTGTVKFQGKEGEYEFSCFRSDRYVRGQHQPVEIFFTDDILLDAKRRDFTANAVYFDIGSNRIVDPLNGIKAIKDKLLVAVDDPKKVFGEDGLRLMRLARQAAQLGFRPNPATLEGAQSNARLILDISPERIFDELLQILTADQKCGVREAPYRGFSLLEETGVLAHILPELTLGKGLAQRADFHKYEVLEHSFRALKYIEPLTDDPALRLAALLHDVGKPACMRQTGNAHGHAEEGEGLVLQILQRLKASKKITQTVAWLTKWHMYDFNCQTGENKLRRFLVRNIERIPDLLLIKQADFSACADELSVAPTVARWNTLLQTMREEGVPFSLKALAVNGREIADLGVPPHEIATVLNDLLMHVAIFPKENTKRRLLLLASKRV